MRISDLDGAVFETSGQQPLFETLERLVVTEERYLEPDLSLSKLSQLLGTSPQQLSKLVNEQAQRNFNDYINYHRIQAAKNLLTSTENDKYTISSIAFEVGFNSLSSFNSAFKKFEGQTPSSFRGRGANS